MDLKTDKNAVYMREYKRKQYQIKGDLIKQQNQQYYYAKKYNIPTEQIKEYGDCFIQIVKLRELIKELQETNNEILKKELSALRM